MRIFLFLEGEGVPDRFQNVSLYRSARAHRDVIFKLAHPRIQAYETARTLLEPDPNVMHFLFSWRS